ncbi:putative disease resistance protein [Vitis vinifera]|nr:putative disease resistance protein [Vitis vinifera]
MLTDYRDSLLQHPLMPSFLEYHVLKLKQTFSSPGLLFLLQKVRYTSRLDINGKQIRLVAQASKLSSSLLSVSVQFKEGVRASITMATEAVISFAVERIGDMLIQEAIFLKGVRGKVERLNKDLGAMKCFLEEAEKKQEEDLRVHKWVSKIRDAVYDVEDIIDMFILKAESRRTDYFLKRVFKKLINRHKVGKKIEAIQLNLQDISNRREALGIKNIGEGTSGSGQMLQYLIKGIKSNSQPVRNKK